MWPKALIELLPHLTRLVPAVNRYFQSRGENDDATRLALERKLDDVAGTLRKDISEASASLPTADISRQLKDHGKSLAEIAAAARTVQSQGESLSVRVTTLEKRSATLATLVTLTLILALVACVLLAVVLVKLHK